MSKMNNFIKKTMPNVIYNKEKEELIIQYCTFEWKSPEDYINVKKIYTRKAYICKLPETLVNLTYLEFGKSSLEDKYDLPDTLINLRHLEFDETFYRGAISKKLINLEVYINYPYNSNDDEKVLESIKRNKIAWLKFLKIWRFQHKLVKLWKIAEYYTAKKYHPNNILNHVILD